uniref:Zinc finger protein 575 n=1 Tax=Cacopsylla melanoneura TaxID=428564 RepID=A0A8D8WGH8_9HEMI
MSDQPASMSKKKTEPGLYVTTYTTTNDNNEIRVIEREPPTLDDPNDTTAKQETVEFEHNRLETLAKLETLDNELDTLVKLEPLDNELDTWVKKELYETEDLITDHPFDGNNSEQNSNDKHTNIQNNRHNIKKHKNGNIYYCNQCPRSYPYKHQLKAHLLAHEGNTYSCDKCPKSFTYKDSLAAHLLTHEGIRHPCHKCPKSFSYKCALKTHLLSHEGIRFPCNKCQIFGEYKTFLIIV